MVFWCSFPSLLVFFGIREYTFESPRFTIMIGKIEEGVEALNLIGKINDPFFQKLDDRDAEGLKRWRYQRF